MKTRNIILIIAIVIISILLFLWAPSPFGKSPCIESADLTKDHVDVECSTWSNWDWITADLMVEKYPDGIRSWKGTPEGMEITDRGIVIPHPLGWIENSTRDKCIEDNMIYIENPETGEMVLNLDVIVENCINP